MDMSTLSTIPISIGGYLSRSELSYDSENEHLSTGPGALTHLDSDILLLPLLFKDARYKVGPFVCMNWGCKSEESHVEREGTAALSSTPNVIVSCEDAISGLDESCDETDEEMDEDSELEESPVDGYWPIDDLLFSEYPRFEKTEHIPRDSVPPHPMTVHPREPSDACQRAELFKSRGKLREYALLKSGHFNHLKLKGIGDH